MPDMPITAWVERHSLKHTACLPSGSQSPLKHYGLQNNTNTDYLQILHRCAEIFL